MKQLLTFMVAIMLSGSVSAYGWSDFKETTIYAWDTTVDFVTSPFKQTSNDTDSVMVVDEMSNPCGEERMQFIREMNTRNGPAIAIVECPGYMTGFTLTINKPADDRLPIPVYDSVYLHNAILPQGIQEPYDY